MRFKFKKKKIELLYTEEKNARKYHGVVDDFFEVMAIIEAAKSEQDLYVLKGLRFERLSGRRSNERSLRLNKQWRLIVILEKDATGKYILIVDIEDYH